VSALAAAIPGRVAVFAQRVSDRRPAIAIAPTAVFPAASVIKLAIMVTAYQAMDRGDLELDAPAPFDANDVVAGSETFESARPGATATIGDLLRAMIRRSDNTASNALIDRLGFAAINRVIARAGLRRTKLQRYFMHFSSQHENETDALDTATLLLALARGARGEPTQIASARSCRAMVDMLLGQEDREKIARGLPPGVPLANKTGELLGVRHDAGIVDPYGPHPYVLVVLERDLRDQTAGVAGIARISRAVYRQLG
jgi:beta-lactamase class A